MSRNRLRMLGGAAVAAVAIIASAGAASAHVTVNPDTATQGGFTKLTFRVPTEKDNASTTKVQVVPSPRTSRSASSRSSPTPGGRSR